MEGDAELGEFSQEDFLARLREKVDPATIRACLRQSPDNANFGWDYIRALLEPLEKGRFSDDSNGDLSFALSNVLVHMDSGKAAERWVRFYFTVLYVYFNRIEQRGIPMQSFAVRCGLEHVANEDVEMKRSYCGFLRWLLRGTEFDSESEAYFIALGFELLRTDLFGFDYLRFEEISNWLPTWADHDQISVLTVEKDFPKAWLKLLPKFPQDKMFRKTLGQ